MPAVFDKFGICFQYPENWTLETESATPGRQSITVYSPGGGFWSVMAHWPDEDPAKLATAAVDAMRREYDELDSEPASEEIDGVPLTGYDLNFYCLDLTNTARIRTFSAGAATTWSSARPKTANSNSSRASFKRSPRACSCTDVFLTPACERGRRFFAS